MLHIKRFGIVTLIVIIAFALVLGGMALHLWRGDAETPWLDDSPVEWLPGEDNGITPSNLDLYVADYSNEELASQYDQSADLLAKLNEWGRITSRVHLFLHKDGCLATDPIRWIKVQAVLYRTVAGAVKGYDWVNTVNQQSAFEIDDVDSVGDVANASWWHIESDCVPADRILSLRTTFRRYNVVSIVDIGSVAEFANEEEMRKLAKALAGYIDNRLIEEANQ